MATDATGAPTPLGIPKYNTSADAPSGLGFNAAMDAIDALLAAKVSKPSGIAANEAVIWDGSTWVRSSTSSVRINNGGAQLPKITTSTMAGGPPGSPSDGDIWIATGVDGNGVRWSFQYNAGSASSYKWEFIGGAPYEATVSTAQSGTPNAAWIDLSTVGPSITIPRSGDYIVDISGRATVGATPDTLFIGAGIGAFTGALISTSATAVATYSIALSIADKLTGLTSGNELRMRYFAGNQSNTWSNRATVLTPIRIS